MPLINIDTDPLPDWSEIEIIKIFHSLSEDKIIKINSRKSAIFILSGESEINSKKIKENDIIFFEEKDVHFKNVKDLSFILVSGNWDNETGNYGFFKIDNSEIPKNDGDPVDYERSTDFDNHYHDCDEYWIILEGKGLAVSEGIKYFIKAGDCVVTKKGDHHDLPHVFDEIKGIYFETTLKGKKRKGHLWNHTHANPN